MKPIHILILVCSASFKLTEYYATAEDLVETDIVNMTPDDQPCDCPGPSQPVCGENGKTYSNPCFAECVGIAVLSQGNCPESVKAQRTDAPCVCFKNYEPVCGVDNQTYANQCIAGCEGVEIGSQAECGQKITVSVRKPKTCSCDKSIAWVCGMDTITYSNPCEAQCAGTSVKSQGKCPAAVKQLSEVSNGTIHVDIKCICPNNLRFVCGVDGITYSNECEAVTCGEVQVKRKGRCGGPKIIRAKTQEELDEEAQKQEQLSKVQTNCSAGVSVSSQGACPGGAVKNRVTRDVCVCPKNENPVCGADGKTYSNKCLAKCNDIEVASEGACSKDTVTPKPKLCVCNRSYRPVCGIDDKTYANACLAKCAAVAVASKGRCSGDSSGDLIPPFAKPKNKEKEKEACFCDRNIDFVCGDDGKTYSNECKAECARATVASKGKCPSKSSAGGSSKSKKPCLCPRNIMEVCGTDGKTYDNECLAKCEDVSVASEGECPTPPKLCTCPRNLRWVCGTNGKTYGNECEAKCEGVRIKSQGKCSKKPTIGRVFPLQEKSTDASKLKNCVCPRNLRYVCGFDGKTYDNACLAECNDVKVASEGKCKSDQSSAAETNKSKEKLCGCRSILKYACGTDGKTYSNECMAECEGVEVASEGKCKTEQSPTNEANKAKETLCFCPRNLRYVCGNDGKTYSNECVAKCEGVSVASQGRCPSNSKPKNKPVRGLVRTVR